VAQPCGLVVSREENLVGDVKVISVSDTEAVKVNPLGITTSTPNNQEIPNKSNNMILDLNLSNLEGLLSKGVNNVNVSSDPNKCHEEITIVGTNTNQGTKGLIETTVEEARPILDLNHNSLEKSILESTDVRSMLSKPSKSNEELNKIANNTEPETEDTKDPTTKEDVPNLDLNHSNTEGLLTISTDIVKDTLALHKEPMNIRI
jgi:hypothetical protein